MRNKSLGSIFCWRLKQCEKKTVIISEILYILALFSSILCIISIRLLTVLKQTCQVLPKRSENVEKTSRRTSQAITILDSLFCLRFTAKGKLIYSVTDCVKPCNSKRKAYFLSRSILCRARVKESIASMSISVCTPAGVVRCRAFRQKSSLYLHAKKLCSHLVTNLLITIVFK